MKVMLSLISLLRRMTPFFLKRSSLGENAAWNGVFQLASQGSLLIATPVIVAAIGIRQYGVWMLINTVVVFAVSLDGGISSTVQRFYAYYDGRGDKESSQRLTLGAASVILLFVGILSLLFHWLAAPVTGAINLPAEYRDQTVALLQVAPIVVGLVLLGNMFLGLLRARALFKRAATSMVGAQLLYISLIIANRHNLTLESLLLYTVAYLSCLLLFYSICCMDHFSRFRFRFPRRQEALSVLRFAWRAQLVNVSALAILQIDSLVVATLLPIEVLGYLALGAQVASGMRSLPLVYLSPVLTRLSSTFASGGYRAAVALGNILNANWTKFVFAYGVLTIGLAPLLVRAWVGDQWISGWVAAILVLGNTFNLLTGVVTSLCRAVGQPGLEARYAASLVGVNAVLSIPSTLYLGVVGAVASTTLSQILAFLYLRRMSRAVLPGDVAAQSRRWITPHFLAALVGIAVAALSLLTHPGFLAMLIICCGACVTFSLLMASHVSARRRSRHAGAIPSVEANS